jgi:hypothetical protein
MVRGREAVRRARFGLSAWRLASCATLSLAGCATVPMGEPGEDEALKRFAVAPDQAGLYVFRHPVAGAAVRMDLELDGAPLGKTIGGTYLFSALAPGRHTLVSRAENTDTLVFDVAAGELAFVRQDVRWGLMYARTKLQRVDEAEGSRGVLEARLAQSASPTQTITVQVEAEDPGWAGPLDCRAANSLGTWPFQAPGAVTVRVASTPLQIGCRRPGGGSAETAPAVALPAGGTRQAMAAGAAVGAGVGAAVAVVAAPIIGPALALLLVAGSALRGAEIGGIVDAVSEPEALRYPSIILVRIPRVAP